MIIEYNKKIKVANQDNTSMVATPNQNLLCDNLIQSPSKIHFHEHDHSPDNSSPEASTQAMLHECLSDGGIDPSDISNVMSAFKAKTGNPPQDLPRKINTHPKICFC